jgi:hypothetical protein
VAPDLLRRAMGKKKPEEMAKHRDIFVEGAEKNGLARAKADELFSQMEKFAGYGFNKSHAAAYALVAYQTAYFKAHHPAAFMAANLSLVMDDTDKVKSLYDDTLAQKIAMLPPDVNASATASSRSTREAIRFGLGAVKGTGRRRSRPSSRHARAAGRSGPLRLRAPRGQAPRQPPRRRGARARRARSTRSTRGARRCSRRWASRSDAASAPRRAARRCRCSARRRRRAADALVATREWTEAERLIQEKARSASI